MMDREWTEKRISHCDRKESFVFIVTVLVLAEELGGGLYDSEDDEDEEEDETDVEDASRPARHRDQADLVSW